MGKGNKNGTCKGYSILVQNTAKLMQIIILTCKFFSRRQVITAVISLIHLRILDPTITVMHTQR